MPVRCKFRISEIKLSESRKDVLDEAGKPKKDEKGYTITEPTELVTISMFPVYGNGDPLHENTKFWQSSPSGRFELGCVNKEATKQFKVGQQWYLDLTLASEPK